MSESYAIHCLSRAIAPITHMSRSEGNEQIIAREPVATPTGIRWIPCLSGNALRHRLVREPGARFLVDRWGLAGQLTMRQLNFLFHGGQLSESSSRQDTRGFATAMQLLPLLRLIGGSLPDAILPGSLICDRGLLVCRENRPRLAARLPGWPIPDNLRSAEEFVSDYQYTRGDIRTSGGDLVNPKGELLTGSNLMIFSGQTVIAGSVFLHGFMAQHVSTLELGALLLSLALWSRENGTIGGQSARGHGQLETRIHCGAGIDQAGCIAEYVAHVDAVKEEAIKWLRWAFEPPAEKPKAKGKARGANDGSHEAAEDFSSVL